MPASASQSALNFIGDQQSAVSGGKRATAVPESLSSGINAAFTLNCFQDYGANRFIEFGFEVGDVVKCNEFHARNERLKRRTIFFGRGNAEGAKSTAVKRVGHGENASLGTGCSRIDGPAAKTRQL